MAIDLGLLGLLGMCAAATELSGGAPRAIVLLLAALVVPGGAVVLRAGPSDVLSAAALSVAISLAIDTALCLASVWTGIWHPAAIAIVIGAASAVVVLDDLRRVSTSGRLSGIRAGAHPNGRSLVWQLGLALPLVIGLGAWAASLRPVRLAQLGAYGLVPWLGPDWYVGIAILTIGAGIALTVPQSRGWIIGAFVVAIVVVLYATIPAISHEPQYTWLYKHIGVVRYIETHGSVDPSVDIYNRWPGFFAVAAVYSQLAGLADPVAFAGWAEPLFALIDSLLVAAIAYTFARDRRVAGLAAVLFSALNWIGQDYFSPQAEAFTMALGVTLVVVRGLIAAPPAADRAQRLLERILRYRSARIAVPTRPGWSGRWSILVVIGLDAVIVVTHQLTPYVLILQLGGLAILGFLRPRWIVAFVIALPLAFLAANVRFIEVHYGLLTSLNPLANVAGSTTNDGVQVAGKALNAYAGELLGVVGWLGAMVAVVVLVRRGLGRPALCLAVLAFAPFFVLLGQSYGGEAGLRVILFSAPAAATLIAWMLGLVRVPMMRGALTLVILAVAVGLFIPATFGASELTVVPADEVAASQYLYAHAPAGSVLTLVDPNFPARVGPRYALFRHTFGAADPNLLFGPEFRGRALGARDVPAVVAAMREYPGTGYLVFSATQFEDAAVYQLAPPGALEDLRSAVARSPYFRLFYQAPEVWIYRLVAVSPSPSARASP
jgi:hypothetical protein